MNLTICTAQRAYAGETVCGDAYAVVRGVRTLIALADGLGHGPAAAEAAESFCRFVADRPGSGLRQLLEQASEEIAKTRGAVAALLRIDRSRGEIEFAGIGNIEVQAVSREPIRPISAAGIVGRRIRKLQVFRYRIHRGDLLIAYTDGISSRFSLGDYAELEEQALADKVLADHGKLHDDATCVVIRCM
jgi:serine/threonine protein phosphatase PrpC